MSLTRNDGRDFGDEIVFEKNIFSKVFDKDIRRVYLYKKSERIAKAIHLVCPAFKDCKPLKERVERLSVELIDASILPPLEARERLSRHLLALSSSIELGKSGGFLSNMNADIILREARNLLQEISSYEEPQLSLPDMPSVAQMSKEKQRVHVLSGAPKAAVSQRSPATVANPKSSPERKTSRKEAILEILRSREVSFIKDISVRFREVSEKTIQRELQQLVFEGLAEKSGERRWTTYKARGAAVPSSAVDPTPSLG